MNLVADDRITQTGHFTNEFVLFPAGFEAGSWGQKPAGRLTRGQLDAFSNAEFDNARSPHFSSPAASVEPAPEKGLAAGVLKQAAHDLRRFRSATGGVKRELYLDAHSWITATDFSWPYSFVNVCKLLQVCPDVIRSEILADASLGWLDYWTQRAGRLSRKVRDSLTQVFTASPDPDGAETSRVACI
jgi:hypothetical protein